MEGGKCVRFVSNADISLRIGFTQGKENEKEEKKVLTKTIYALAIEGMRS